jgi:uncharacterized protein (UPF0332 family)
MKLSAEDKKNLCSIRLEKAEEFLQDAAANLEESRLKTAVNRAYYAVLNAARALLILEGVDPETHSGAVTTLSLRFIKTGILPVVIIRNFKILLSRRTDVDYGDFEIIEREDAEDSVKKAGDTIEQIKAVIQRLVLENNE